MKRKTILLLLFSFTTYMLQAQIKLLQQGKPTSIRGMSVVNDKVAWISGSKGYVAFTINGGQTWAWQQVKGLEQADFRSIEAFSAKEAIIMSSGTPALILKTIDGGASWQLKYKNTDTAYFLDAMAFYDKKHGFTLGDPINNKFVLLETMDGGETWLPFKNCPEALPGEAAFAASGTCLRVDKSSINFVTGGTAARFFTNFLADITWHIDYLPIIHGKASQGIFSFANDYVFVGGDYANDKSTDKVACRLNPMRGNIKDGFEFSEKGPSGYQSCVEYISKCTYISTGTLGSNLTTDCGQTWAKIDSQSFNVCRKAKHGKLVLLAGNNGAIGKFSQ
jgi:photosystem II stability/assembly factor-like uncharacterized protein